MPALDGKRIQHGSDSGAVAPGGFGDERAVVAARAAWWPSVVAGGGRFGHAHLNLVAGGGLLWLGRQPRLQMAVVAAGAALRLDRSGLARGHALDRELGGCVLGTMQFSA